MRRIKKYNLEKLKKRFISQLEIGEHKALAKNGRLLSEFVKYCEAGVEE